jgi:hypothetical protein
VAGRLNAGHTRRIVTVADATGYSKLSYAAQQDLQTRMAGILDQAAVNARLDRRMGDSEVSGDGTLTAWPPGINELHLIADYVPELARELDRVNSTLSPSSRIRLRLSITAGLVDIGLQGPTGQAPIEASVLVNSDELREALRKHPERSLVVIIDETLYKDVVLQSGLRGLRPEDYQQVVITDKYDGAHRAWITVLGGAAQAGRSPGAAPGAARGGGGPVSSAPAGKSAATGKQHRWGPSTPVIVAIIGAVGAIAAALVAILPGLFNNTGDSAHATTPSVSATATAPSAARTSPPGSPTPSAPTRSAIASTGQLHLEEAYNHLGSDLFADPTGAAVTSGPPSIPFGAKVWVKCWAPNESSMSSINVFYLVESAPYTGEYAPANTFLNADTPGTLDPKVPECAGYAS